MEKEIVKTDKRYRKNLFNVYLICIAGGIAFWRWGRPFLITYLDQLPLKAHIETVELLSHIFLLLFIPPAIYLITIGYRVIHYKAFPYPGMKVIRNTVIIKGKKAVFRGKCMVTLGMFLIIMIIGSMCITHKITLKLKHHPLFRSVFYGSEQ